MCHTHLEDLHLLQHEFLHLLVILGQHDDLLHCPAVWNGPGRASVGLRTLGKGYQPQPLPPPGPKPPRAVEQELCTKVEDFPSDEGARDRGGGGGGHGWGLPLPPQTLILGSAENRMLEVFLCGGTGAVVGTPAHVHTSTCIPVFAPMRPAGVYHLFPLS